jgi:hypothetical protein
MEPLAEGLSLSGAPRRVPGSTPPRSSGSVKQMACYGALAPQRNCYNTGHASHPTLQPEDA